MGELPQPPREISANGQEVWDWAGKFSEHVHRQDKIRKLSAEIRKPNSCGDCHFWMKSRECPREHNVNGQTRGPSCDGFTCQKFQATATSISLRADKVAELSRLTNGGDHG
jgi:hypothetical protein